MLQLTRARPQYDTRKGLFAVHELDWTAVGELAV